MTSDCLLNSTINIQDQKITQNLDHTSNTVSKMDVILPPTPTPSDDEVDEVDEEEEENDPAIEMTQRIIPAQVKLARRGTVSLADLIPVASAALRTKHRLSMQQQQLNNPPSTQDSPLARALTKVKVGLQTHRIKERFLLNEWIRLALAAPLDESTINSNVRVVKKLNRTRDIVAWYEYKFKRTSLTLEQLESKVDELRRKKLLLVQQQSLPSPPPTRISFQQKYPLVF